LKTIIVLVMHGVPPKEFPKQELTEFFMLHGRLPHQSSPEKSPLMERYSVLNEKIKNWPRNPQNDPFCAASQELAGHLSRETCHEVLIGYMEFCSPEAKAAMEEAANGHPDKIVVVTPMMTRGGAHSEVEIPAMVKRFREQHPEIKTVYAWPFDTTDITRFLAKQIAYFV
jgi:sirohydrochlorin cobaltochelatase